MISICKPYIEQDFLFSICVIMITVILAILFQKSGDLMASGIKCVRENVGGKKVWRKKIGWFNRTKGIGILHVQLEIYRKYD